VRSEKPVYWYQGLFLQPQHFQLSDRHNEYTLHRHFAVTHQHHWGVVSQEIREDALYENVFELTKAVCIFQDGTLAELPGNTVTRARSFKDVWTERDKPFQVYLGIRRWNGSSANVTEVDDVQNDNGVRTRYISSLSPENMHDMHSNGQPGEIKRLHLDCKIFWENELAEASDYTLLPIAQLVRDGSEILLNPEYAAPCLTHDASPSLMRIVKDIRDRVLAACNKLEQFKATSNITDGGDGAYMVFFLALRTVSRFAPEIQMLSNSCAMHPWEVYMRLRTFIGELSCFSAELSALGETIDGVSLLPEFEHTTPYPCFKAAHDVLARLLSGIAVGPEFLIRFTKAERYYTAEISPRAFNESHSYWLIVTTAMPAQEVNDAFQSVVKVSSTRGMTTILARAVQGIPVISHDGPPRGLPKAKATSYFKLDPEHPLWQSVESGASISLYWDQAPEDLSIQLGVLKG
jgi:type VI secretion system protein ImpJ